MPSRLRISTTPFRSTLLSIPPSPHSPRSPVSPKQFIRSPPSPIGTEEIHRNAPTIVCPTVVKEPHPPRNPLPWLWRCHICKRVYPLGATRRCLDDGHYLCSGQPLSTQSTGRARRRGPGTSRRQDHCASEFDYQGWKTYGDWRRGVHAGRGLMEKTKDDHFPHRLRGDGSCCQKDCSSMCDYPSECRWSKKFLAEAPFAVTTTENECLEHDDQFVGIQLSEDDLAGASEGQELTSDRTNFKRETFLEAISQQLCTEAEGRTDERYAKEEHCAAITKSRTARKSNEKSNSEKVFEMTVGILEKLGIKHRESKNKKFADRTKDFSNFFSNDVDDINIILIRNMTQHLQIELKGPSLQGEDRRTMEKDMALLKLLEAICTMTLHSRRPTGV